MSNHGETRVQQGGKPVDYYQ